MSNFLLVDSIGTILGVAQCDDISQCTAPTGGNVIDVGGTNVDPAVSYWNYSGNVVANLFLFTANSSWNTTTIQSGTGGNTATFGNALPNPTYVSIAGSGDSGALPQTGNTTTGSVGITAQTPGLYTITLTANLYVTYTEVITAL